MWPENNWILWARGRYVRGEIDIDEFEHECERALQAEADFNIAPPAAFVEYNNCIRLTTDEPGTPLDLGDPPIVGPLLGVLAIMFLPGIAYFFFA